MSRFWHHIDQWECVPAGLYESENDRNYTLEEGRQIYRDFLSDTVQFEKALQAVISTWPIACQQFLSNPHINRIAWLGQASATVRFGISRKYRGGFLLLSPSQQYEANKLAEQYLKTWTTSYKDILAKQPSIKDKPRPTKGIQSKIQWYKEWWAKRGYPEDIPESVPFDVFKYNFAPSYQSIGVTLLSNDLALHVLGFPIKRQSKFLQSACKLSLDKYNK